MPRQPELCPICHRVSAASARPFCSSRCAQIDLGRWFGEGYVVPGQDGEALRVAGEE